MKSKQRKKAQRLVNKKVRLVNKGIVNDELWRGRFFIHQKKASWYSFEDGSGGELFVTLEMCDKRTGNTKIFHVTNYSSNWQYFCAINNFIVDDCAVWEKEGRDFLYSDKTDYTKVAWSN